MPTYAKLMMIVTIVFSLAAVEPADLEPAIRQTYHHDGGLDAAQLRLVLFEAEQIRAALAMASEQWHKAENDAQRESICRFVFQQKYNVWTVDPSGEGILRAAIMAGHDDTLKAISEFRFQQKLATLNVEDWPQDISAAMTRIFKGAHVGRKLSELQKDLQLCGFLTVMKPSFDNVSEIPTFLREAVPKASDRTMLLYTNMLEMPVDGKVYTWIIVHGEVVKFLVSE